MAYYKPEELEQIRNTLKEAKNNPNDPRSQEIFRRINEGKMNFELKALGLPPVEMKRPKVDMAAAMRDVQMQQGQQSMMPEKSTPAKVGGFLREGAEDIGQGFIEGVKAFGQAGRDIVETAGRDDRNLAEKATMIGGRAFSGAAEGIFDPLLGAAKAFLPQSVEDDIAKATAQLGENVGARLREIYQDAKEGKGETKLARALDAFAVRNIDAFINSYQNDERFRDQVNAALGFTAGIIPPAAKGTITTAREVGGAVGAAGRDTASMGLTGAARLAETAGPVIQTAGERAVGTLGKKADQLFTTTEQQAKEQIQSATARITGGKPEDIAQAAEAMKLIAVNPEQITSYQDLVGTVKGNIKAVSEAQDAELSQYTERYTPDTTATYEKVGDVTVSTTPVKDALDGLETAYTKSGEAAKAERIRQLRSQFETDGLTVLELNQIAREYGIEFKDRAFTKTGDAKTGYNAEAFENIRSGVKEVVRERLPDEYSKELDTKLTQLYTLDRLTTDMYDKVFTRLNKMPKQTVGRMISQSIMNVVDVADMLTGRVAGNLMREMVRRSGVAQKNFLNPIELEKELQQSLKEISKLMDIQDDKRFEAAFTDWYNNLPVGMSIKPINPDDNEFFLKISDSKHKMTDREFEIASETLQSYGLSAPNTKDQMKSYLEDVTQSQQDMKLNRSLNSSFNQGATPSTNLLEEAKGKTLDAFMGKQKPLYHGTNAKFDKFDASKVGSNTGELNTIGTFFAENTKDVDAFKKTLQEGFGRGETRDTKNWRVVERYLPPDTKVFDLNLSGRGVSIKQAEVLAKVVGSESGETLTGMQAKAYIDELIEESTPGDGIREVIFDNADEFKRVLNEEGYIGYTDVMGKGAKEFVIFDPEKDLVTKSQLEDIWKQANQ